MKINNGDIVICIIKSDFCLTFGRCYEILYILGRLPKSDLSYLIIDDKGIDNWYPYEWFITLKEYRKQKLLLIANVATKLK